jgi:hypothetical protein
MTTNSSRLSDDLLRRALTELAAGADGDMLLTDVMRTVDARPQVARRPWDTRGWGRTVVLVAAATLLVAATIGATVVLTRPQPTPQPTRTPLPLSTEVIRVPDFVVPFTYRLPVGMGGQLEPFGSEEKVFTIDGHTVGSSGTLELFPVSGMAHACGASSDHSLRPSIISGVPTALLDGLRSAGAGIGPATTATLGNLPAVAADVDPSLGRCPRVTLHIGGLGLSYAKYEPALDVPGRMVLAQPGRTIGVWISAPTAKALANWLPIAQTLIDGLSFDSGP